MYCVGKASSDRLYRVALLRNQFTDTILKAREKHLKRGSPDAVSSALGKPRPFPDALLTASGKPRSFPAHYLPFPTHTYGVRKTYALGISLISHVRLVSMHTYGVGNTPYFSMSCGRRMNCASGKPLIFDVLLYASRIAFSPDVLLYALGEPLIPEVFYADVFFDVGKSPISCSDTTFSFLQLLQPVLQ
ncbi:Bromodomain-containing protein [Cucumis melo var. makuwa]|uniref:Bromodomain-containing protein n=1 Tax=Cucumis melo var. makuwa TaxID=1194695 RepID=A0A5A7SXA5_CUCMM|nr:Bromodomain-containing protein [Cucumis melo var. makuwa]TYK30873.1 Bromodomain-containing protein [Cucumis melo var. makuwa]